MKNFFDYLQCLGLKCLIKILAVLPENFIVKVGENIGLLLTKVMPNRYKRSVTDIQKVFPNKTEAECKEIAKESWSNIGRIVTEFAKATTLSREEILKRFRFVNCEQFFKDNAEGKGVILLLGHFANWETLGYAMGIKSKKMTFVAYPQNNGYVNDYVQKLRGKFGSTMISSYNPFFAAFRALKRGAVVAILADQSVGSSKLFMDFLGRPAEVSPMPAVLSLKSGLPVYHIRVYRDGKQIVVQCTGAIQPLQVPYSTETLYEFSKILKKELEDDILAHPSDWLWAHNRWKREHEVIEKMKRGEIRGD